MKINVMKITSKYSHINGEEYLLVHNRNEYKEIKEIIKTIDTHKFSNLSILKLEFKKLLTSQGWNKNGKDYVVSSDVNMISPLDKPDYNQKKLLKNDHFHNKSWNQTEFIKSNIAVEVILGKYAFVVFELFVKHLLLYSGGIINVGVEILPTKKMQSYMSSGVAYYEGEVYNILRHGRTNPPVPLLILGIEP